MKKWMYRILALAMLLSLSACGGKPAAEKSSGHSQESPALSAPAAETGAQPLTAVQLQTAEQIPAETQKQILEANRSLWEFTEPYESPWFYTFTDLDHNGRLEVVAASTQGTGVFTYGRLYEVNAEGTGVENCYHENTEIEGPDDWPEIVLDSLPCYYDRAADRYYYPCEGITHSGYAYQYFAWHALCLKNGTAEWEFLADKEVSWDEQGAEHISCRDAAGSPITTEEYKSVVEQCFAGMEKSELTLDWTRVEIPWEEADMGWIDEPVPETPSPVAIDPDIVITKNPTSEALAIGGKTWFIAHADNAASLTWQLLTPEGQVCSLPDAVTANPGLVLEALEGDTLAVSNVPLSLNGWGVQARFDSGNGCALTEPAYIYVGDFITAYGSVIEKYRTAYATGNANGQYAWEHGISDIIAYSGGVGYALKDLDKNGIPELIIAGMGTDDFSQGIAYDLYTLENGLPVNIMPEGYFADPATSSARSRYYVLSDNSVLYEGSGGAAYSYVILGRLNGSVLEEKEMVFTDYDEGSGSVVFYAQQGYSDSLPSEKSVRITEGEFSSRWDQWKSKVFVPPLTKIY